MQGYLALKRLVAKARSALILGHQNSDPDAICSAYALLRILRKIKRGIRVEVASPDGVSRASAEILKVVPLTVLEDPHPGEFDIIVTVDTNTLEQLGELKDDVRDSGQPLIMIDHHAPHPETVRVASVLLCDETATSTCELVFALYRALRLRPSRTEAFALFTGMAFETGHFLLSTSRSLRMACDLIGYGVKAEDALALIRMPMEASERIARLKAAQRVRIENIGPWTVALTNVGSYHASAARGLVGLGANLAIVAGSRKNGVTVSLRSTKEFLEKTGIHLGRDVAKPLGEQMGGMGGGHATAAGAHLEGEVEEALKRSLGLVRTLLAGPETR